MEAKNLVNELKDCRDLLELIYKMNVEDDELQIPYHIRARIISKIRDLTLLLGTG